MKQAILARLCFGLLIGILISGCRKKELDEVDIATKPSHCNGIKDFDEIIIDGGGVCGSNGQDIYNSCHNVDGDSVLIGSYRYAVDSCTKKVTGGEQIFTVYYKDGTVKLTFSTDVYLNYDLDAVSFGSPAEDEFDCTINDAHYGTKNPDGIAMLNTNGVDYSVQLCGGEFYISGNPKSVNLYAPLN